MSNFFDNVPDEILVEIFKSLSFLERIKVREVCKRFKNVAHDFTLSLTEEEKVKLPATVIDALCDEDDPCVKNVEKQLKDFKELLAMGADPNMTENCDTSNRWPSTHRDKKRSLLEVAAWANKIELAALLLKKGANANWQDTDGRTALYYAAREGHAKLAKLLLNCDTNHNLRDEDGNVPAADLAEGFIQSLNANDFRYQKKEKILNLIATIRSNAGWEKVLQEEDDSKYVLHRCHFN